MVCVGVWEWEWVEWGGSGVGIVYGELWMYPDSITPLIPTKCPYNTKSFPTYPDRIRTARHTPCPPPSPNSHPPYLPYTHPTPAPTLLRPTRHSTISIALHTLSHPQTHPTSRLTPTPQTNPSTPL